MVLMLSIQKKKPIINLITTVCCVLPNEGNNSVNGILNEKLDDYLSGEYKNNAAASPIHYFLP